MKKKEVKTNEKEKRQIVREEQNSKKIKEEENPKKTSSQLAAILPKRGRTFNILLEVVVNHGKLRLYILAVSGRHFAPEAALNTKNVTENRKLLKADNEVRK